MPNIEDELGAGRYYLEILRTQNNAAPIGWQQLPIGSNPLGG